MHKGEPLQLIEKFENNIDLNISLLDMYYSNLNDLLKSYRYMEILSNNVENKNDDIQYKRRNIYWI